MSVKISRERFALGSYQYGKYPFSYFLDTALMLEISQVELWAAAPHLCPGMTDAGVLKSAKRMLRDRKLQVCCITPEQCTYPVNLAAEEERLREYSVCYFKNSIDMAEELESGNVLVTAGYGYYNQPASEARLRGADSLYELSEYAKKRGIHLILETLTPMSSNIVNTPEEQRTIIESMPEGSMGAVLDIGQMVFMGQELQRYLSHGKRLRHVHLHDSHPAIHMALGDGDLPLEEYLEQIERSGYQGRYGFEMNEARYREDPRAADKRSVKWLKSHGILND